MRMGVWLGVPLVLVAVAATQGRADDGPADKFSGARQQCDAHIVGLKSSARNLELVSILIATIGGLGAAVSGLKAGSSEGEKGKRWGIIALVSGIAAAAAPQIPTAQSYEEKLTMADRHRTMGLKVERQIPFLDGSDESYQRSCARYVLARYTDCLAQAPIDPPDLPVHEAETPRDEAGPIPVPSSTASLSPLKPKAAVAHKHTRGSDDAVFKAVGD
jgi:hypothetical protein